MLSILFVDDEPNILQGIKRSLHHMRSEWALSFAASGAEALALLQGEPVDIIVSDLRMPSMNGFDLLTEVSQRHPGIKRVILSGTSVHDLEAQSTVAHRTLSKPCDPALLKTAIVELMN